jgi:hypothetical protein
MFSLDHSHQSYVRSTGSSRVKPASELDLRAEENRALARQPEIVGRLGGDHRGGEEELLAPAAHPGPIAGLELDLGEEV